MPGTGNTTPKQATPSQPARRGEKVTLLIAVIAIVLTVLMIGADFYGDWLSNTAWGTFQFPLGSFLILLIFVLLINAVLRKIVPRQAFSTGQLMAIWALTSIPFGVQAMYIVPNMVAYHYVASPENNWDELFGHEIPRSLVVQDSRAVNAYFEGLPTGARVNWRPWYEPIAAWSIYAFAWYGLLLAMAVILRRRWVEQERFTFPLVQVPLELARSPQPGRTVNAFLRNKQVWIAVGMLLIFHSLGGLHNFFPSVPYFPLRRWFQLTEPPLMYAQSIELSFFPMMVGLAYVLSSAVAFSLWFFYLVYKLQMVIMGTLGLSMESVGSLYGGTKWAAFEEAGGTLALAAWFLWLGRRHFTGVLRKAFAGDASVHDEDEPMTYSAASWLLLISATVMIIWLGYFGGNWVMAVLNVVVAIGVYLTIAWTIVQGGVFWINSTFSTTELAANLCGSKVWGSQALLINMWNEQVFRMSLRNYLLPYMLNAFKVSDSVDLDKRSMLRGAAIPFVLAYVVTIGAGVWLRGVRGGLVGMQSGGWLMVSTQTPFRWVSSLQAFPVAFQFKDLLHFVLGGAFTLGVAWMHIHFSWFGIHPIGFLVASGVTARVLWFSLFVGWLLKAAIMRWGGYKVYQNLRPFFYGLVIGDCLTAGIWNIVGYITGQGYAVIPF